MIWAIVIIIAFVHYQRVGLHILGWFRTCIGCTAAPALRVRTRRFLFAVLIIDVLHVLPRWTLVPTAPHSTAEKGGPLSSPAK